jgi:hypothetical protein
LIRRVKESVDAGLQAKIAFSPKGDLLHGRVELVEDGSLKHVTRQRRHYLSLVPIAKHRKALTRLVLSNHCLSIETLRYPTRCRVKIPREFRLCRFCVTSVETEAHAMLGCEANSELMDMREHFLKEVFALDPQLQLRFALTSEAGFMRDLLASCKAVARFARYVYDVLNLFRSSLQWIPTGFQK